eukprot:CAMPEP_0114558672 /NCGR_PEP_ID=MMETSP0114-20121206/10510_1 /TAXON_ID=31324 /ORGANISM="Goniomonas sp, Strain m" /LENGTH=532 /DNA_ID=CAMNT_0001744085 /DNA_START=8 /DNA_END=1606 /DNA_ORIENTATION=+
MARRVVLFILLWCCVEAVPVRQHNNCQLSDLAIYFRSLDMDLDGVLSPKEIQNFLQFSENDDPVPIPSEVSTKFMDQLDTDGNYGVSWNEFCSPMERLLDSACSLCSTVSSKAPQQIHLAPGGPQVVRVSWVTSEKGSQPVVQFGLVSGSLNSSSAAVDTTYDGCGHKWEKTVHTAAMAGLATNSTYYYRVGDETLGEWSQEYSFSTQPDVPVAADFAVYGDQGTAIPLGWKVAEQVIRQHEVKPFDSIILVGDIAYASTALGANLRNDSGLSEVPEVWDVYSNMMAPVASLIPHITGVGNHEKFCNYSSFITRYHMPGDVQPGGGGNLWFSVDRNLVHFTFISTEHDYTPGSQQRAWLEADLAAASEASRRAEVPWVIVGGHRPMYCSDTDEYDSHRPGAHLQDQLEPLFNKYGVDVYLSGHMHMYERMFPIVANGTVDMASVHHAPSGSGAQYLNPNGTVHLVQGTGGAFVHERFVSPAPAWSATHDNRYGMARMRVESASELVYTFMDVAGDTVVDELILHVDNHGPRA